MCFHGLLYTTFFCLFGGRGPFAFSLHLDHENSLNYKVDFMNPVIRSIIHLFILSDEFLVGLDLGFKCDLIQGKKVEFYGI